MPSAARAEAVTWAAAAAAEVKTSPMPTSSAPWSTDAPVGRSLAIRTAVSRTPTSTEAAPATSTAAAVAACLPVTVPRSSSNRPDSSSARVCRTTRKLTISATTTRAVMVVS